MLSREMRREVLPECGWARLDEVPALRPDGGAPVRVRRDGVADGPSHTAAVRAAGPVPVPRPDVLYRALLAARLRDERQRLVRRSSHLLRSRMTRRPLARHAVQPRTHDALVRRSRRVDVSRLSALRGPAERRRRTVVEERVQRLEWAPRLLRLRERLDVDDGDRVAEDRRQRRGPLRPRRHVHRTPLATTRAHQCPGFIAVRQRRRVYVPSTVCNARSLPASVSMAEPIKTFDCVRPAVLMQTAQCNRPEYNTTVYNGAVGV